MNQFRNLAAASLVSLLTGLASCDHKPTPAESFYQQFPDSAHLMGAGTVQKYETRGAKHCLVHIRQVHDFDPSLIHLKESQKRIDYAEAIIKQSKGDATLTSTISELENLVNAKKKEIAEVRNAVRSSANYVCQVQHDIYSVLIQIHDNYSINSIRNEGVTTMLSPEDCMNHLISRNSALVDNGCITQAESEDPKTYLLYGGAALGLGTVGSLQVKPAEDVSLNKEAVQRARELALREIDSPDFRIKMDAIHKPREDYILTLIDTDREPYSVIVFGAEHDFRDNVNAWNKEHPADTFSLIVVTPASYKERNR